MLHFLLFLRAEPEALGKDWDTNMAVPQLTYKTKCKKPGGCGTAGGIGLQWQGKHQQFNNQKLTEI